MKPNLSMPYIEDGALFSWGKGLERRILNKLLSKFLNYKENWGQEYCLTPNNDCLSCASFKYVLGESMIVGYFISIC